MIYSVNCKNSTTSNIIKHKLNLLNLCYSDKSNFDLFVHDSLGIKGKINVFIKNNMHNEKFYLNGKLDFSLNKDYDFFIYEDGLNNFNFYKNLIKNNPNVKIVYIKNKNNSLTIKDFIYFSKMSKCTILKKNDFFLNCISYLNNCLTITKKNKNLIDFTLMYDEGQEYEMLLKAYDKLNEESYKINSIPFEEKLLKFNDKKLIKNYLT